MAFAPTDTGTELAALAEQTYGATLHRKANWDRIVTSQFVEPETLGGEYGNQVNIGVIDTATYQDAAVGTSYDLSGLTYNTDTETNKTIAPARIYSAIHLGPDVRTRFIRSEQFRRIKGQQLRAALAARVDAVGATLASSVSWTVGGAGQDLDDTMLAGAIALLTKNAKEYFMPGRTKAYLYVTPMQVDDVITQQRWTNAEVRGDGQSAVASGWVNDSYNIVMKPSGNVYTSGGIAHNLLHVKGSHYLCWWENIHLMEPQIHGLDTFIIATGEHGSAEIDEDLAVDIQTQDI